MALYWEWEKRRPLGLSGFKNREMLWLWCRLEQDGYKFNQELLANANIRANHIIDRIEDVETVGRLAEYRDELFANRLEDEEFSWIKKAGDRLIYWIHERLWARSLLVSPADTNFDQSILKRFDQIVLAFDLSKAPISVKKEEIKNLRREWSQLIEIDPYLTWIKEKDDSQCRWLVDEISKSDLYRFVLPDLSFPVDNQDRLLLFVNALDRSGYVTKLKILFLNDLKNKWARKKKKDDAEKVQCNLNVNAITKEDIKKLADGRGLKMGEYIDAIVAEDKERVLGQSEL